MDISLIPVSCVHQTGSSSSPVVRSKALGYKTSDGQRVPPWPLTPVQSIYLDLLQSRLAVNGRVPAATQRADGSPGRETRLSESLSFSPHRKSTLQIGKPKRTLFAGPGG